MADNDKRWRDMNPDEQAVLIRQITGAVNGLQFRVQDLEEAVPSSRDVYPACVRLLTRRGIRLDQPLSVRR